MSRAIRLPLELGEVPLDEITRMRTQDFWLDHNLGYPVRARGSESKLRCAWRVARENREIPDMTVYPKILAVAASIPAERHQLWVSVLVAGGSIRTHSDSERAGAVRVHVPLVGAGTFEIEGESIVMRVGEFWAVDTVGRRHGAHNDGSVDRVHLLVDVRPNPWLRTHVPWL